MKIEIISRGNSEKKLEKVDKKISQETVERKTVWNQERI